MPCRLRVACVGDSLTRGDGLHEHPPRHRVPAWKLSKRNLIMRERGNYPMLLSRLLGHNRVDVRNFGRGASTACNLSAEKGPPYVSTPHFLAALRFQPHVVILMLGTNDAKGHLWRQVCKDAVRPSLVAILRAFLTVAIPPRVLLVLEPPAMHGSRVFGIERALLGDVRQVIAEAVAEVSDAVDAAFKRQGRPQQAQEQRPPATRIMLAPPLPIDGTDASLFTYDKLHLNANGTALVACSAHQALRQLSRPSFSKLLQTAMAGDADSGGGDAACGTSASIGRSCFDPFCRENSHEDHHDDAHLRECGDESGVGAAYLLTGMACSPVGATAPARAACAALRRRHPMGDRLAPDHSKGGQVVPPGARVLVKEGTSVRGERMRRRNGRELMEDLLTEPLAYRLGQAGSLHARWLVERADATSRQPAGASGLGAAHGATALGLLLIPLLWYHSRRSAQL